MATPPLNDLNTKNLRSLFDRTTFQRGTAYYEEQRIYDTRRAGNRIFGKCLGSYSDHYEVEATLRPGIALDATCECPVGADGRCKHVAALMLEFLNHPQEFADWAELSPGLKQLSRDQLAELVGQIVDQAPSAQSVVRDFLADNGFGPIGPYHGSADGEAAFLARCAREHRMDLALDLHLRRGRQREAMKILTNDGDAQTARELLDALKGRCLVGDRSDVAMAIADVYEDLHPLAQEVLADESPLDVLYVQHRLMYAPSEEGVANVRELFKEQGLWTKEVQTKIVEWMLLKGYSNLLEALDG